MARFGWKFVYTFFVAIVIAIVTLSIHHISTTPTATTISTIWLTLLLIALSIYNDDRFEADFPKETRQVRKALKSSSAPAGKQH